MSRDYANEKNYYFTSFVYRLAAVYAWIRKINDDMVYLDTTIASREDLYFIKFLKLFSEVMCDVILFDGFEYDSSYQTDHVFRNNLDAMAAAMMVNGRVCTFSEFQNNLQGYMANLEGACEFIDGMSPEEKRYRWDRIQILHLVLISFLNAFGYDFQETGRKKISTLLNSPRSSRFLANFIRMLERDKLADQKSVKAVLKRINKKHKG